MRIIYADPPYLGCGKKYAHLHDDAMRWDRASSHIDLMAQMDDVADAWGLSCTSGSLRHLLPGAPDGSRVAAWVKPFASFKPNVNPAYAWEPVIFKAVKRDRSAATVRDWTSCNITMRKGLTGAKPEAFCFWLFDLLGASANDELEDIFPGTGIVGRCWDAFCGAAVVADGLFAPAAGEGEAEHGQDQSPGGGGEDA